ncbi:MAG: ImmA/IrrE family metallo-endopeptidase [Pseudomonadota bacterium]
MTQPASHPPHRWASIISLAHKRTTGENRFPVNVARLAKSYTALKYPTDAITMIKGASLPGFDGGLIPDPRGEKGWGIIYNHDIKSQGRIRFTLAHEFGHYLMHRATYPKGLHCRDEDFTWATYSQVEHQANNFASALLMPIDDLRSTLPANEHIDLEDLSACADHYGVSLVAMALRWIEHTSRTCVLIHCQHKKITWAKSSRAAQQQGLVYTRQGKNKHETPPALSLAAATTNQPRAHMETTIHRQPVWFGCSCEEATAFSHYDQSVLSLLSFDSPAIAQVAHVLGKRTKMRAKPMG